MYRGAWFFRCVVLTIATGVIATSRAQAKDTAILINGAHSPTSNHCRYYKNLERGTQRFADWDRAILAADGVGTAPNTVGCAADGNDVMDSQGFPQLVRKDPSAGSDGPATLSALEALVRKKLAIMGPNDAITMYVTDHGGLDDHSDATVALWGQTMSVAELRKILDLIPESHRVVLVQDQCYGGGMLGALWGTNGVPRRNACGFAAAGGDELARDGGGLMKMIDTVMASPDSAGIDSNGDGQLSFGEAYRTAQRLYSTVSMPVSTGDLFLTRYFEAHRPTRILGSRNQILTSCLFSASMEMPELTASLKVLLEQRRKSLQEDLYAEYSAASMDPTTSFEAVDQAYRTREAEANEAMIQHAAIVGTQSEATMAWFKATEAKLYDKYVELKGKLESLRKQLAAAPAPTDDQAKQLKSQLSATEAEYEPLRGRVREFFSAAGSGRNSSFNQFVADKGGPPPAPFPKDIYRRGVEADVRLEAADKATRALGRLRTTIASANALNSMLTSGDSDAMTRYLDMMACEDQRIGPFKAGGAP